MLFGALVTFYEPLKTQSVPILPSRALGLCHLATVFLDVAIGVLEVTARIDVPRRS